MVIANQFSANNNVFNANENAVAVLEKNKEHLVFHKQEKQILAKSLAKLICSRVKPALS